MTTGAPTREVFIVGIGQTKVGEHWERSLRDLAVEASLAALDDAALEEIDSLVVANMLASQIGSQGHLGALIADYAGLRGKEAIAVDTSCGSGGMAVHVGYLAVASGLVDTVLVTGVEKMTDGIACATSAALAMAADADYEAAQGLSFAAINALLMQRYMYEHGVKREDLACFTINTHRNALGNPYAMFHRQVSLEDYLHAKPIAAPISLLDSSPICDGAAAVILCSEHMARERRKGPMARIVASAVATDSIALAHRRDLLTLEGAKASAQRAYQMAGVAAENIDFFELHDAFSITAALGLEAAGFAARGEGVRLAREGEIALDGRIPICTMGGLKGRGHPVGASGVYQVVEAVQQLRGEAGQNQLKDCRLGMTQSIGGSGATTITHILERVE